MKKNEPKPAKPATLAELAAELEATKKKLARTERKLEREKDTSRLWFNALDEARAELKMAREVRDMAISRADLAQDRASMAQDRADRLQNMIDKILGIDTRPTAGRTPAHRDEDTPRHRRHWQSWRSRRK